jgi:hypothetical protein
MHRNFTPYYTASTQHQQQPAANIARQRSHRKPAAKSTVENTVKYIGVCCEPSAYRSVVRAAPDSVVKTICNAALNVERGAIKLSPSQKALFRQHRQQIAKLTSRRVGLPSKRRVLEQRGGAFWIPALIGAALGGLGSTLFGGNKS